MSYQDPGRSLHRPEHRDIFEALDAGRNHVLYEIILILVTKLNTALAPGADHLISIETQNMIRLRPRCDDNYRVKPLLEFEIEVVSA